MAGQGTVALELLEQAGPLDVLLVCLGGGGLLVRLRDRDRRAVARTRGSSASSPRRATTSCAPWPPASASRIEVPRTIADGQQLPIPGELTFPVIQELVRRGRHRLRRGDRRRHAAAVRAREDRRRAERRVRVRRAAGRARSTRPGLRVGVTISGGNVDRRALRGARRLTLAALAIVLASAALHAGWNALVAGAEDTHATAAVAMLTGVAAFAIPAALTWRVDQRGDPVHRRLRRARARLLRPARRRLRPRGLLVRLPGRARLGAGARPAHLRDRARRAGHRRSPRVGVLAVTGGVLLVRGVGTEAVDDAPRSSSRSASARASPATRSSTTTASEHANAIPYFEIVLLGRRASRTRS